MPIYIESRGIGTFGNPLARHEYLIYVPAGEELNYSAWKYIGAFPDNPANSLDGVGSGNSLVGERLGESFVLSTDAWRLSEVHLDTEFSTVEEAVANGYANTFGNDRARRTVYEGSDESSTWDFLVEIANDLDKKYTYKVTDLPLADAFLLGPTVNSNSFVSSILRHAATLGKDVQAFETSLNEPGNQTWLGRDLSDFMDAGVNFAPLDQVRSLFGGGGPDILIANDSGTAAYPFFLVGGDDTDSDLLQGGAGVDVLADRFLEGRLLSGSDRFYGADGNDTIIIVDPNRERLGGMPDEEIRLDGSSPEFLIDGRGTASGIAPIGGGNGLDTLDLTYLNGSAEIRVSVDTLSSIERILSTRFSDTFRFADDFDAYPVEINSFAVEDDEYKDAFDFSAISEPFGLLVQVFGAGLVAGENLDGISYFGSTGESGKVDVKARDVGSVNLTARDDYVKIYQPGGLSSLDEVYAGGQSDTGDTLDFTDLEQSVHVVLGEEGSGRAAFGQFFETTNGSTTTTTFELSSSFDIVDFENVVGSSRQDFFYGNSEDNIFVGGAGGDSYYGQGGTDFVAYDPGSGPIFVRLTGTTLSSASGGHAEGDYFNSIEGVVGTNSDDTLIGGGDGDKTLYGGLGSDILGARGGNVRLSGGEGNDAFEIDVGSGTGPAIIWGGQGADTYDFLVSSGESAGIVVANVSGLTESSFHNFELSDLRLAWNFEFSEIDAVIVNPELRDSFFINGHRQEISEKSASYEYYAPGDDTPTILTTRQYDAFPNDGVPGKYEVAFLGPDEVSVYAAAARFQFKGGQKYYDEDGFEIDRRTGEKVDVSAVLSRPSSGVLEEIGEFHRSIEYFANPVYYAYLDGEFERDEAPSLDGLGVFETSDGIGPWFILGGVVVNGSIVSNGEIGVSLGGTGNRDHVGFAKDIIELAGTVPGSEYGTGDSDTSGGTGGGSSETGTGSSGDGGSGATDSTNTTQDTAPDLNGDGTDDFLWRKDDGRVSSWNMEDGLRESDTGFGIISTRWDIAGVGDFNGDGTDDVLWRRDDGWVSTWNMDGGLRDSDTGFGIISTDWEIAGVGDFNGDGTDDILWRKNDGRVSSWNMKDGLRDSDTGFGIVSNDWDVLGVGDFDGDGTDDILWRKDDGRVSTWDMNNGLRESDTGHGVVSNDWEIEGVGDFNGDGTDDILWRKADGWVSIWNMDGGARESDTGLGIVSNDWEIEGVGDFNGDGTDDILWRKDDGWVSIWNMEDSVRDSATGFGVVSTDWSIDFG